MLALLFQFLHNKTKQANHQCTYKVKHSHANQYLQQATSIIFKVNYPNFNFMQKV